MSSFVNFKHSVSFNGYTLLIPSVSVGNVPQLTVDLLITTLNCKKIATIWHPAIIPSVGSDPFNNDTEEICTACELYADETSKIAILQLRSAVEFKLAKQFFQKLNDFICKEHFNNVIILASSFDYELHEVGKGNFYYVSNYDLNEEILQKKVLKFEPNHNGKYLINGSGFAMKLYAILVDSIKCLVLVKYVSEGDNHYDTFSVVETLCYLDSNLNKEQFKTVKLPTSWQHVYGGPPPIGIY